MPLSLLLFKNLLLVELTLVELQAVQVVDLEVRLNLLNLTCSDTELVPVVLESDFIYVYLIGDCGTLVLITLEVCLPVHPF